MSVAIKTENLTKVYKKAKAVDSINIEVKKGDVCGFVGPNGAGKTTTIGMLTGMIEPSEGRCFVNDIEVTKHPIEVKRVIGYMPDGFGFYGHMNATRNLKYFARLYGIEGAAADAKIRSLLETVGLTKVDKPTGTYSRGMRQRLGLARALINDPQIIFLDEPTIGVDPEGVVQFRKVIKEQADAGKTIFFSSHILTELEHICNTVCIISHGKIMAQGTLDEVKTKMRGEREYRIIVKVLGTMPKLTHPLITDAVYHNGSAVIKAKTDIRDEIAIELVMGKARLTELRMEEESLEDVFMETVYKGV
ncbi:MAG: ABC transporter ATP-binding protein [Methanocella sp.]